MFFTTTSSVVAPVGFSDHYICRACGTHFSVMKSLFSLLKRAEHEVSCPSCKKKDYERTFSRPQGILKYFPIVF